MRDKQFLLLVVIGYTVVSFSLLLSWPLLWPDEAIFADTARNVLVNGHPATTLVVGMESGSYWQPPVWFYSIAPVISVFGFDILPLRIASVVIGILILCATFVLSQRLGLSSWASKTALVFLAFNPNFVTYVKLVRMDGLCLLFTLVGLIAYLTYVGGGRRLFAASAGSLFALAVLTHPLGLIGPAVAAGHALLGRFRRMDRAPRTMFLLLAPVVVAIAAWYLIIGHHAEVTAQLAYQLARKSRPFTASIASFAERYRSLPMFALLIPAGVFFVWVNTVRNSPSGILMVALSTTLSLAAVVLSFELSYHVYCLPYVAIAGALCIESLRMRNGTKRIANIWAIAIVCNFAAYFLFFNYQYHYALRDQTDYPAFAGKVSSVLPPGANVCISGYPCLFWGLTRSERDFRLFDETFLSDSLGSDLVKKLGWFVVVNGLGPEDDRPDVVSQIQMMNMQAARVGKTCVLRHFIGTRLKFAYTARVFELCPMTSGGGGQAGGSLLGTRTNARSSSRISWK